MPGSENTDPFVVDDPFPDKIRQLAETGLLCCLQCSNSCGIVDYAARICPQCAGPLEIIESKGAGEIYSFVVYHTKYAPEMEPPYTTIFVELEEGCRLSALLEDDGSGPPAIGDPVKFDRSQDGKVWFRLSRN